jgi:hypothetical protein
MVELVAVRTGQCGQQFPIRRGGGERTSMWNVEIWGIVAWLIANIPMYLLIGRIVFGSWDGLFETWDETLDESEQLLPSLEEAKILGFVIWVIAILAAEYEAFDRLFLR